MHTNVCVCVLVAQLCLTLCDPMDCSLPDSIVHGILQGGILELVAIPFSWEGIFTYMHAYIHNQNGGTKKEKMGRIIL